MFKKILRVSTASVFALILVGGLASCSTDASTSEPEETVEQQVEITPAMQALIDQANEEGALNLTYAVFYDDSMAELMEAFQKSYGLDLNVQLAKNSNVDQNVSQLLEEANAGIAATSDVVVSNAEQVWNLGSEGNGVIEAIDVASLLPAAESFAINDGEFLRVVHQFGGFTYNTNAFNEDELPESAADVVELVNSGKVIASTTPAAFFNLMAYTLGAEGTIAHASEFEPAGLIACGEINRIASGEFDALWVGCGKSDVDMAAEQGAPLGFHVVEDMAFANEFYLGVPKNAAHPAAAQLFAVWMTTPEAQQILWNTARIDNVQTENSHSAEFITEVEANQGIEIVTIDADFAKANSDMYGRDFRGAVREALTS